MTLFVVLNFVLALFFGLETIYTDKTSKISEDGTNPIILNILLLTLNVTVFSVIMLAHNSITPSLLTILLKICLVFEGCLMVNIGFCYTYYAWKYTNVVTSVYKTIWYIVVFWLVFGHFKQIQLSAEKGIVIQSNFLFVGKARQYFPWTWFTVYNFIFKFLLPGFMSVIMLCRTEAVGSKLDKYKSYIYFLGIVAFWVEIWLLNLAIAVNPVYSLAHYYTYVAMMVIIPLGSRLSAAPSGRGTMSLIVKGLFTYILPAVVMGIIFMGLYPLRKDYPGLFVVSGFIAAGGVLYIIQTISKLISKSSFGHSADYAVAFEKDLATVDYNGEMDAIADDMFRIFKRNAEASSMNVYINGGNDTFDVAYTSNGKAYKIENQTGLFEELLEKGRNVVLLSQVESMHDFADIKDNLLKFFKTTDSDALFILNEGRDIHGMITLGLKMNQDHYKEYDYNVFTKLYSYFFVFGYFMRNIANKEIIGTVNRELRMSSQIITSIQDNIDILEHPKMDAGCIMVPAHNIGGEFVDMIRLTDSRHMFVVGDLSGKGIAASMSMVILKAIIRAYLSETHDFKQLVVKINRFIRDNLQKGTIFSGMFAIVNFENDTMYYINCGIPAILLYTEAYNNVIEIQGEGHILGFVKDITPFISVKQIKLNKNDIVLACTDGLIESHSLRGEKFGKDRVQRLMVANAMYPASRMAQFEYDELVKFMSHEMEDDVSVLILKYLQSEASERADAEVYRRELAKTLEKAQSAVEIASAMKAIEDSVDNMESIPEEEDIANEVVEEDLPDFDEQPVEEPKEE